MKMLNNTILSNREIDCLGLWIMGVSSSIGAKALNISSSTVLTYRQRALEKLGTRNKAVVISFLKKNGDLNLILSRLIELILLDLS